MRNGVYRQSNAVLYAYFPHQLGYVRLHGALLNAQDGANFLVGAAHDQHLQNFLFAVGERHAARWEDPSRARGDAFDEERQDAPGGPNRALVDNPERLRELGECRGVARRAWCDGRERENYRVAGKIDHLICKIQKTDKDKIKEARQLVKKYVDVDAIIESL